MSRILVLGPDIDGRGGIASSIQTYIGSTHDSYVVKTIKTYSTGCGKYNGVVFLLALINLFKYTSETLTEVCQIWTSL